MGADGWAALLCIDTYNMHLIADFPTVKSSLCTLRYLDRCSHALCASSVSLPLAGRMDWKTTAIVVFDFLVVRMSRSSMNDAKTGYRLELPPNSWMADATKQQSYVSEHIMPIKTQDFDGIE